MTGVVGVAFVRPGRDSVWRKKNVRGNKRQLRQQSAHSAADSAN